MSNAFAPDDLPLAVLTLPTKLFAVIVPLAFIFPVCPVSPMIVTSPVTYNA